MATAEDRQEQAESGFERMRDGLRKLYHGSSPSALRFQLTGPPGQFTADLVTDFGQALAGGEAVHGIAGNLVGAPA